MRDIIIKSIVDEMEKDQKIFFLTADMGINLVEIIENKFPNRYANVGIAEQNLIGVAAGLANVGFRPILYTISNFIVHRCFEQIRNDIVLHQYPITLIGTSTGYDNAPLGPTHHVIDDWGVLRNFPNLDIYCPGTLKYAQVVVGRILSKQNPAYIRIPKGNFIYPDTEEDLSFSPGLSKRVLLISYGSPAQECLKAKEISPDLSLLMLNKLSKLDNSKLGSIIANYDNVIVVEDHFSCTGLYSVICEFCISNSIFKNVLKIAPDNYCFEVGTKREYFYKKYGINAESILRKVELLLDR